MPNDKGQKPVVHTKKHVARLQRERQQTRMILFSFIGLLAISVGVLVYGYLNVNYFQLQKPVAKVGSVEITLKDFQTRVRLQRNSLISTYMQYSQFQQMFGMDLSSQLTQIQTQLSDPTTLGQGILDAMVNEALIRQEAAKRGITISDAEMQDAIQGAYQFFPNGTLTPTVTPTPVVMPTISNDILKYVTATLEATATPEFTATPAPATATATIDPNVTVTATATLDPAISVTPSPTATVTVTLAPTETATATIAPTATIDPNAATATPEPTSTPYTLDGFKSEYAKGLTQFAKFGLTEQQYRDLYMTDLLRKKLYAEVTADVPTVNEQIWARHILVADEATALAIIERLKNGEDFGVLAAKLSTDTGSGAKGGDLGWFGKGMMVAPFEEAAFALKVGEISAPVKSDFGYHIIQVIARQERPLTADELTKARDAAFTAFLTGLRTTYSVVTYDIWKTNVPTDPSFESLATEAAITQSAATKQTQPAK
jgi:peptidyl-prolyl cis-trans isomerase D